MGLKNSQIYDFQIYSAKPIPYESLHWYVKGRPATPKIHGVNLLVLVVLKNHYGHIRKTERR